MNTTIEDIRRTDNGIIQGASHTCHVLNHKARNSIIVKAVCDLRKIQDDFDSIACCGISGIMVAPQVADLLKKNVLIVRKKDDKGYSEFRTEGVAPFRYVVIDDLVCSGSTLRHIKKTINQEYPRAKCMGLYCYLPHECAYNNETVKMFERDFGCVFINPNPPRV